MKRWMVSLAAAAFVVAGTKVPAYRQNVNAGTEVPAYRQNVNAGTKVPAYWQNVGPNLSSGVTVIRAGRLWDGTKMLTNASVIIENGKILSVGTGTVRAQGEVIDLSKYTVIPGLIDLHTHMTYYWDQAPGTRPLG